MCKKSVKNVKKCKKVTKRSDVQILRRHTRSLLRRGRSLSQGRTGREVGEVAFNTLGGRGPPRIVTLRGSARGSYLEILPQQNQIMPSISKVCPLHVHEVPNPFKILPKPLQSLPKTFAEPFKIDPKSSQKASWTPS